MAEKKNEVAQQNKFTTSISEWTNNLTDLVTRDFTSCGVDFDEYSKQCAMSAMTSIFQMVKGTDKVTMQNLDTSNLREIVGQCASLKLNANSVPRECYFQLRTKKIGSDYFKVVEMGIEGDGNDALLRQHGVDVDMVYPCWLVKEGDDFTYPTHKGIEVEPPTWNEKGISQTVVRVVYPVKMKDGTVQYLISERASVKNNLFAHVKNTLLNETFGICKDKYHASDKQKEEIAAKKKEILDALKSCETIEDMCACEKAIPYMSPAWSDNQEAMIVRKMRNNATKKFPKSLNTLAKQSLMQMDETYQTVQAEIQENANSEEFIVDQTEEQPADGKPIEAEREPEVADAEIVEGEDVPDFLKG